MSVVVITPPTAVLGLELVKHHLRVEHDDDDALIKAYVAAATGHIDGPDGWLGRALGEQVLELRCDDFSQFACGLPLPFRPIRAVTAIKYVDSAGAVQDLDLVDVALVRGHVLRSAFASSFPTPRTEPDAVRIEYRAGYPDEGWPPAIVAALLLMVGDLYANRETGVTGTISADISMSTTVTNLLAPFRVWDI